MSTDSVDVSKTSPVHLHSGGVSSSNGVGAKNKFEIKGVPSPLDYGREQHRGNGYVEKKQETEATNWTAVQNHVSLERIVNVNRNQPQVDLSLGYFVMDILVHNQFHFPTPLHEFNYTKLLLNSSS